MNDVIPRRSFLPSAHSYLRLHIFFWPPKLWVSSRLACSTCLMWVRLLFRVVSIGQTYGLLSVPELLQEGTWPASETGSSKV